VKRIYWSWSGLMLSLVLAGWWGGLPPARAGVITVCPAGCDYATIQGAVNAAASLSTIQIFPATYTETVVITKSLTLAGVGQPQPVVSGNDMGRPFTILGSVAVTMTNMTVTRGRAPLDANGSAQGGGIFNQGQLTLDHVTLSHNQAIGANEQTIGDYGHMAYGGGLYSQCTGLGWWPCPDVYLTAVTVISNTAKGGDGGVGGHGGDAYGGGVFNDCFLSNPGCASVYVTDSYIGFNKAQGGKGGDAQYPSYHGAEGGESRGGGFADRCFYACGAIELIRSEVFQNIARGGDGGDPGGFPPPAPADALGGGIHTHQLPLIQASHIHHNQAITGYHEPNPHGPYSESRGGGIHIWTISSYLLEGGIHYSTLDHNSADVGGGLVISYSGLPITNSTISHNVARICGAGILHMASSVSFFDFVTITENEVLDPPYATGNSSIVCPVGGGSGIYVSVTSGYSPSLKSSLLVNNLNYDTEGEDCFGTVLSRGFNFTTECTLVGNLNGTILNEPIEIGSLQDNGGLTPTHALLAGSGAIDAAAPADCPNTDQRQYPRWVDGNGDGLERCDMGAYEYGGAPTDVGLVGTVRGSITRPLSILTIPVLLLLAFYALRNRYYATRP